MCTAARTVLYSNMQDTWYTEMYIYGVEFWAPNKPARNICTKI